MKHEFDEFAQNYRDIHSQYVTSTGYDSYYFVNLKVKKLQEWLPTYLAHKPSIILDFGCGDGVMAKAVQKTYPAASVYGVDPSSDSIAVAEQNALGVNFSVSGTDLKNFNENYFNLIYCAGVFHHIPFEEHEHYLKELYRVLQPGGIIVLFELNPLNPGTSYIFKRNPIDVNAKMLTPWYAKKITKPYGYVATNFYCFYPKVLKPLSWTEKYLTKIPLGGLYATIIKK